MKVLDFRYKGARELLGLSVIRDLPIIGRGSFAAVFDKGDRVMKLTVDKFQHDFLGASDNPLFPRVYHSLGQVGEVNGCPAFLVEMEKLNRIEEGSFHEAFVKRLISEFVGNYPAHDETVSDALCCAEALLRMSNKESFTSRLQSGLLDIAEFVVRHNCIADFHAGNFMLRDKQIVFHDPVADGYVLPF